MVELHSPPFFAELVEKQAEQLKYIKRLVALQTAEKRPLPVTAVIGGNTNSSGNLDLIVYRVAAGFDFSLHRVVIESQGSTPASPFQGGSAWCGIYVTGFAQGNLRVPLPLTAASGGGLPLVWTDGSNSAAYFRDGEMVVLHMDTGPATKQITVHIQGLLWQRAGALIESD